MLRCMRGKGQGTHGSAVLYALHDAKRMLHIAAMPREASSIRLMRGDARKWRLVYA